MQKDTPSFQDLEQEVEALALPERTLVLYALHSLFIFAGLSISFATLFLTNSIVWQIVNGIFMGFLMGQIGFLAHDLSHCQIFRTRAIDRSVARIVWPLFGALSESHWYKKHNAHHKFVNHLEKDPDLEIPFVFSSNQLHSKTRMVRKYILPHQDILFFLVLPFAYLNFVLWTLKQFFQKWDRSIFTECVLVCVHVLLWIGLPLFVLPLSAGAAFIVAQIFAISMYMSIAFAPNHKGEAVLTNTEQATWIHQIELTRNLHSSKLQFFLFGGLNYQIEHHLFPSLPRFHYPHIQPIVKSFCCAHNIRYYETSWHDSIREIYRALKENRVC